MGTGAAGVGAKANGAAGRTSAAITFSTGVAMIGTAAAGMGCATAIGVACMYCPGVPLTVRLRGTLNFWPPLAVTVILACTIWPGAAGTWMVNGMAAIVAVLPCLI